MTGARFSAKDAQAMQDRVAGKANASSPLKPPIKRNKHGNVKVYGTDGSFDSKKEYARFLELKILLHAGEIKKIERQVAFGCTVNGRHICKYIADFVVTYSNDEQIIEDVKSEHTRKDPVYRLKRQLMIACNGLEIIER